MFYIESSLVLAGLTQLRNCFFAEAQQLFFSCSRKGLAHPSETRICQLTCLELRIIETRGHQTQFLVGLYLFQGTGDFSDDLRARDFSMVSLELMRQEQVDCVCFVPLRQLEGVGGQESTEIVSGGVL